MKTRFFFRLRRPAFRLLYYSAPIILTLSLSAATNDLTSALQKGLFEEEANHNLDAAAQAYQAVSAQFDKDRKLAATAIFRLGEVYRKQGKTNEAVAQYERIVREFSDQETLATLSRQNLAGIGRGRSISTAAGASEPSAQLIAARAEVASLAAELQQLKSLSAEELRLTVPHNYPNPTLTDLMKQLAAAEQTRVGLEKDFAPEHPEVARVTAQAEWLEKQIQAQVSGTVRALEVKLNTAKAVLAHLGTVSATASPAARAEQHRLLEAEVKLLEGKLDSEKLLVGAGRADGMTLIATQRELLALKRQLVALSPGATLEDIRTEQGRLFAEEIGLVEQKLARMRARAADRQDQGGLSDTERELLALKRQRVALATEPLLATTSEATATLNTDDEEKEFRRIQAILRDHLDSRSAAPRIYVWGQVRNQGAINLVADEKLTVAKAILRAGGFGNFANKKRIKVVRPPSGDSCKIEFEVNMIEVLEQGKLENDLVLQPDDWVIIPSRTINF